MHPPPYVPLYHDTNNTQFADFAKPLCQELRARGHWADYIDPCSGLPVRLLLAFAMRVRTAHPPIAIDRLTHTPLPLPPTLTRPDRF